MTHQFVIVNPQLNHLYPVSLCSAADLWDTVSLKKGNGGGFGILNILIKPLFQRDEVLHIFKNTEGSG